MKKADETMTAQDQTIQARLFQTEVGQKFLLVCIVQIGQFLHHFVAQFLADFGAHPADALGQFADVFQQLFFLVLQLAQAFLASMLLCATALTAVQAQAGLEQDIAKAMEEQARQDMLAQEEAAKSGGKS